MDENKNEKRKSSGKKGLVGENLSFSAKEAFKRLRTNIIQRFPNGDEPGHIIGITSAQPSEGKSTVALNLAYSLAELGKRVLLVDADMRRSSIHIKLAMEKEFPEKRLAWVEMEITDGTLLKSKVYSAPGEHTDPELNFEWIIKKFRRITAPIINSIGQDEILNILTEYSQMPIREIIKTINGYL